MMNNQLNAFSNIDYFPNLEVFSLAKASDYCLSQHEKQTQINLRSTLEQKLTSSKYEKHF